jgi:hypothetical protein
MTRWTTIPPWLYRNDLSDADLQRVCVEAARREVAHLREERDQHRAASRKWRRLDGLLAAAEAFLEEAEAARAGYEGREADEPRRLATAKELPKP